MLNFDAQGEAFHTAFKIWFIINIDQLGEEQSGKI